VKKNIIKILLLGGFLVLHPSAAQAQKSAAQAQTQDAVNKLKATKAKLVAIQSSLRSFKTALKTANEGIGKGLSEAGKYKNDFKDGKGKINDTNSKVKKVSSALPYVCTQVSTGGIDTPFNVVDFMGTLNDMVNRLYSTYDTALTSFREANQNMKYPGAPIYAKLDKTIADLGVAIKAIEDLIEKIEQSKRKG